MKIIALNGPPRSGKDTIGSFFKKSGGVLICKFAEYLKNVSHRIVELEHLGHDAFEGSIKDEPNSSFYGLSPRKFYIALSELFFKPTFGPCFFGDRLIERIEKARSCRDIDYCIITDSGFNQELQPLIYEYGVENVFVFQIQRPGCSYDGDSRSYLNRSDTKTVTIENRGSLSDLRSAFKTACKGIQALEALAGKI